MQELALFALGEIAPGDLRRGRVAQVVLPERRYATTAREHLGQGVGLVTAREVRDRAADFGIAGQRAVTFLDVPGRELRPLRERERHRAVTRRPAAELELAVGAAQAQHRVLAEARDQAESLIGWRQGGDRLARGLEELGRGSRTVRPLARIEGIEVLAELRRGQDAAEAGERRQHLARKIVSAMLEVEHRHATDERVSAAQRLHRDEHALVRRAELDHPVDTLGALVGECRAGDEAARAVADEDDVLPLLAQQPFGELAAVPADVAAPVVGMEHGVEAGDAQHEPQALIGELEDADRPIAAAGGHGELHELALRDLDRVEPGDVGAALLAQVADRGSHDAWQDQQARPAAHACGAPGQPRQLLFRLQIRRHRAMIQKR